MAVLTSRVKFTDGAAFSGRFVVIAARPVALDEDDELTRLFTFDDGEWFHTDLDMDVWAVCATRKPVPSIYGVGRNGRVYVNQGGEPHEEAIKDAGHEPEQYGYLYEMREIDGTLYTCGDSGQVYRRERSRWVHFDDGPLDRGEPLEALALYGIDGTSERDIYAVGQRGVIWHHDGRSWTKRRSPTKVHLNAVRCVDPRQVYLCGDEGVLFKGHLDDWESIPVPAGTRELTAVERFQGKVYISAGQQLLEYQAGRAQPVLTGLKQTVDSYRLDANEEVLWSFGVNHLCFFDGEKWTYVKHPDNP